jgi:hypothetical protein
MLDAAGNMRDLVAGRLLAAVGMQTARKFRLKERAIYEDKEAGAPSSDAVPEGAVS